jgi:spore maturation protein CgeB
MVKHGYSGWVRPVSFEERVRLYQRSKIGFNIHWNEYGIGNQRLFHLPANGVMQICDCPKFIDRIFEPGREIVGYESDDDLVDKLRYFLDHEEERKSIALQGYRRTMRDYRFATITRRAGELVEAGMERQERPGSGSRRTMGALGTL